MSIAFSKEKISRTIILTVMIGAFLCFAGCDNQNAISTRNIKEIINQKIQINPAYYLNANGITTNQDIFSQNDFTIVAFIDSVGCTECNMLLKDWTKKLIEFNRFGDNFIDFVMVLESRKPHDAINITRRNKFNFPILIDTATRFRQQNELVNISKRNSIFLTNSLGEILAFGNPIRNPKVDRLFTRIIKSEAQDSLYNQVYPNPALIGVSREINSYSFEIVNNSDSTLNIERIVPSCDCIQAYCNDTVIEPHSKSMANFNVNDTSNIHNHWKFIEIYFKEYDNPTILKIRQ